MTFSVAKLLPSMLSLERRTNSKAVQNKLLRSLGESVARLEPPSRRCCTNRCCDCCTTSSRTRFMLTCATGLSFSEAPHTCWVGFSRCPDAWGFNGCGSGNAEACSSSSKDHTPGERSCAPFSLSSSRWTSEESWAFWIISVRSSSSQLEERSFPHAAVCVVETQVIGSASGETRAKITSSLSSGSKSPFQTTAIRTFQLSQRVLKSTWATCNRRQPV